MFLDNEKHKTLAFPAGEGADQLLRREADEGYAQAASSVRQPDLYTAIFYSPNKISHTPDSGLRRQSGGGESNLQIKSPRIGVHVQHLPREGETGYEF